MNFKYLNTNNDIKYGLSIENETLMRTNPAIL